MYNASQGAFFIFQAKQAVNCFEWHVLKLTGITGEAEDAVPQEAIEVLSWRCKVNQPTNLNYGHKERIWKGVSIRHDV